MPLARLLAATTLLFAAGAAHGASPPPNPAAALCIQNGATVTMETAPNGSQHGVCIFPNGSRIDEGAYFRNKHRGH